jgi:8-oxo-dGTP pyrophosphatase MutT (NUDIX family)
MKNIEKNIVKNIDYNSKPIDDIVNNTCNPFNMTDTYINYNKKNHFGSNPGYNKNQRKKHTQINNKFCGNCGKYGHIYKMCKEPITSLGILTVKIDINPELLKKLIEKISNDTDKSVQVRGIKFENLADRKAYSKFKDSIKFLMIKRRHTLGFIEFIRGRYKIDNVDGIISLFEQMIAEEIELINTNDFDELWSDLWFEENIQNKDSKTTSVSGEDDADSSISDQYEYCTSSHDAEYKKAKDKFNQLKYSDDQEFKLEFYVQNVTPNWSQAEWGFPKGRRNLYESSKTCACREFEEETDLKDKDYILLENMLPVEEEFYGTNGIKYKHIYYIGMMASDKEVKLNDKNRHQSEEIGDIGLYSYDDAIKLIRPYHMERRKLLTILYMYIINTLVELAIN